MNDFRVLFYKKIIVYSFITFLITSMLINLILSLIVINSSCISEKLNVSGNFFKLFVHAGQLEYSSPSQIEFINDNILIKFRQFDKSDSIKLIKPKDYYNNSYINLYKNNNWDIPENIYSDADIINHEVLFYQTLYPEMYANLPNKFKESGNDKIIYLTFDDGPSTQTEIALDILKEYCVKATFFVMPEHSDYGQKLFHRILNEGHVIGVHTYSHEYDKIYKDVESFLHDFNEIFTFIYNTTGYKPNIFRFPGGSINSYNVLTYKEIISEMLRRGFIYYDWNIDSGDANTSLVNSVNNIHNRVVSGVKKTNKSIVLFHDSKNKTNTMKALPNIIEELKESGYIFDAITNDVKPFIFAYK